MYTQGLSGHITSDNKSNKQLIGTGWLSVCMTTKFHERKQVSSKRDLKYALGQLNSLSDTQKRADSLSDGQS